MQWWKELRLVLRLGLWVFCAAHAEAEIHHRIINGSGSTAPRPWMVSLGFSGSSVSDGHFCGGVLIAPDTVVTAAHCVVDFESDPSVFTVAAGQLRLTAAAESQRRGVTEVVIHPDFDLITLQNDIALLLLDRPFEGAAVVDLARADEVVAGAEALIFGWGLTDPFYPIRPDHLQQASVPIQDEAVCEARLGLDFRSSSMLCAGTLSSSVTQLDGTDACSGDSGGPLLLESGGRTVLAGITSWGFECGSSRVYGVYTRVSAYRDWILSRPVAAPRSFDLPLVLGIPMAGMRLRCAKGEWHSRLPMSQRIEWLDFESGERLARGAVYKIRSSDVGRKIACSVTAENSGGARTLDSDWIGPLFPAMRLLRARGAGSGILSAGVSCRGQSCRLLIRTRRKVSGVRAFIGGVWRRAQPMGAEAWQVRVPGSMKGATAWIREIDSGRSAVATVKLR